MNRVGDFIQGLQNAGGRFCVHDCCNLVFLVRQRSFKLLWVQCRAPLRLHLIDSRTAALGDIDHARAEHTVYADEHRIAWFHKVDKASFHTGTTGTGHRQCQAIFRLKNLAQHSHTLIHNLQEFGIEMADHWQRKCLQYARIDRALEIIGQGVDQAAA